MTALITVGNSDGKRSCDEKCYMATGSTCSCCCGGMNHGKGYSAALDNTRMLAQRMIKQYEDKTGLKVEGISFAEEVKQQKLF